MLTLRIDEGETGVLTVILDIKWQSNGIWVGHWSWRHWCVVFLFEAKSRRQRWDDNESVANRKALRLCVCVDDRSRLLDPVPDSQRTATELFQSPPFGSGTVFRSTSHPRRHFPSSALASRHTSSNCVIHNTFLFIVPVKWHRLFGHVNHFYLLTYLLTAWPNSVIVSEWSRLWMVFQSATGWCGQTA